MVTAETIVRTQARDALEALERTATSVRVDHGSGGVAIHMRGRSGIAFAEECMVVLNAAALSDAGYLRHIPAQDVSSIRILTPEEAMPRYGLPGGGGVIEVSTRPHDD